MARCKFPYQVERKLYFDQQSRTVPVPCGKCPDCLKRRLASWSFRLEVEALNWEVQHFVTLTYNTEYVPISDNTFMTLNPSHLTNYFKRLRKRVGQLKYYACGEYGTQNKRPHYHLIIFGNSNMHHSDVINAWTDPDSQYPNPDKGSSKKWLNKPYGDVYFGKVEAASIRYTVQYYDKGDWYKAHQRDDRVPEFSRMSQGIGRSFLTPAQIKAFLLDPSKGYIYDKNGHKIAIPAYYKKRLYDYLAPESVIAHHPSILVHRDDMVKSKDLHHKAIAKIMEEIPEIEVTEQLNADRQAAILNYRASKRKTRK